MKDYKESNIIILRSTLSTTSFLCQNAFEKCTTKTELCSGKSYIKMLYTRLQLQMPFYVPA